MVKKFWGLCLGVPFLDRALGTRKFQENQGTRWCWGWARYEKFQLLGFPKKRANSFCNIRNSTRRKSVDIPRSTKNRKGMVRKRNGPFISASQVVDFWTTLRILRLCSSSPGASLAWHFAKMFGKEFPTATKNVGWEYGLWLGFPFTASGMLLMNTMYLCASQAAAESPPYKPPQAAHSHSLSSHTGCPAPSPAIERCLENQVSTLALEASAGVSFGFPSSIPIFQGRDPSLCAVQTALFAKKNVRSNLGDSQKTRVGTSLRKGCSCCLVPRLEIQQISNGSIEWKWLWIYREKPSFLWHKSHV